jgi:hypothetical protein
VAWDGIVRPIRIAYSGTEGALKLPASSWGFVSVGPGLDGGAVLGWGDDPKPTSGAGLAALMPV